MHSGDRTDPLKLTPRQKQIVALVCDGHNNESIANQLEIRNDTARKQLRWAMRKLCCNTRLELAVKVLRAEIDQLKGALNVDV